MFTPIVPQGTKHMFEAESHTVVRGSQCGCVRHRAGVTRVLEVAGGVVHPTGYVRCACVLALDSQLTALPEEYTERNDTESQINAVTLRCNTNEHWFIVFMVESALLYNELGGVLCYGRIIMMGDSQKCSFSKVPHPETPNKTNATIWWHSCVLKTRQACHEKKVL